LGTAPVLTVRDSGGAATWVELDAATGDGSSVRRRTGFFVEQRGREKKGRGKWGQPARVGRRGGSDVRAEWGPGRPWRAPGGGGRRSGALV
jgi:hypothetical protein